MRQLLAAVLLFGAIHAQAQWPPAVGPAVEYALVSQEAEGAIFAIAHYNLVATGRV